MKKQIAILICLALLASMAAGCAAAPAKPAETAETEAPIPVTEAPAEATEAPAEATEAPAEATEEPAEATEEPAAPANSSFYDGTTEAHGHYRFQPKVCSSYQTELFGETMRDAWFNLVDAVMAGEDTFACPDAHTYDWVMGQFPDKCFPILGELIDYCYDRSNPVKDGVASFVYLVPKEEAAARIEEFAALVEGILNSTLEDDFSDVEKALALYIYFSRNYVYDYEAARPDIYADYLSSYRVLTTGTGICQEFSVAYAYLLLQAGVDATNMSGHRSWDDAGHQWTFVKINGHDFHIDPTYVIGDSEALTYFMMTDEQRETADGYSKDDFVICSNYAQDHPHPDYAADDDSFSELWNNYFFGFDHETKTLYYVVYHGEEPTTTERFDYSGW